VSGVGVFDRKDDEDDMFEVWPDFVVLLRSSYYFPSSLTLSHMHVHTSLGSDSSRWGAF
jgi:hypothetical protein